MAKKPLEEIEKVVLTQIQFYRSKRVRLSKTDICATIDMGEEFWTTSNEKIWKMVDSLRNRGYLRTYGGKYIELTDAGKAQLTL